MAESDPSGILIIDKKHKRSRYANTEPGVQVLIDQIGGIHNVHLARLWSARKFLLLEGKDLSLLRQFHLILYPNADLPLDALPMLPIGGWNGWQYAVGSTMALKNAVGDRITSYCVLDSDYHGAADILARYEDADRRGVNLHIWCRKEIENYLLQPRAIRRVLLSRIKNSNVPSESELRDKLAEICDHERHTVEDGIASSLIQGNRKLDVITANKAARKLVEEVWAVQSNRSMIVSGKSTLAMLSEWTQQAYGTTFGAPAVARQMTASDIPDEMAEIIRSIEEGSKFMSFEERKARYSLSGA
jgi:hypothetical protein